MTSLDQNTCKYDLKSFNNNKKLVFVFERNLISHFLKIATSILLQKVYYKNVHFAFLQHAKNFASAFDVITKGNNELRKLGSYDNRNLLLCVIH